MGTKFTQEKNPECFDGGTDSFGKEFDECLKRVADIPLPELQKHIISKCGNNWLSDLGYYGFEKMCLYHKIEDPYTMACIIEADTR